MNSLQLEYFFALAEYKNFSETARRLYVAQPAISKQIATLENELNMKLFSRIKGRVDLTEEGRIMLHAFQKMSTIFEKAKKDALQLTEATSNKFHIGFVEGADIGNLVVSSLQFLKQKFSDINIIPASYLHDEINKAIHENEINLALTIDYDIKDDQLVTRFPLYYFKQAIVVSTGHPLAQNTHLDYDLMRRQIFFATDVGLRSTEHYCNILTHNLNIKQENIVSVPNIETLILNIESGLGIALLSETPRLKAQTNIKLFPLDNLPPIGFYATWKRSDSSFIRELFINSILENNNNIEF